MDKQVLGQHLYTMVEELDGFSILDENGFYLYVSKNWSDSMGMTLEDLENRTAKDIFEDTQSDVAIRTGRKIVGIPVRWGRERVPGITNYYPFRNESGEVAGCYCIVILAGADKAQVMQNQITELVSRIDVLRRQNKEQETGPAGIDVILGESPEIVQMKNQIRKVAGSNSSVLIEGETGTGKELVARALHELSRRKDRHFVRVNCSAIPPELMESEFFGYEKGAFTGASSTGRVGKFRNADKGTIFLDEINSLPYHMQPKFLRVLQEREVEPVGSDRTYPIDIRVIAAANTALAEEVREGRFREDLYYRLNVIRIKIPPLRERKTDIPMLVEGMIRRFNQELGTYIQGVSPACMSMLMKYDWPGNVRELQNAIESAVNLAESSILQQEDFYELHSRIQSREARRRMITGDFNLQTARADFEKNLITDALEMCENNHSRAAQMLGISRTMLYKKITQYDIKEK